MQSDLSRLYSGVYQFELPFNATCSLSPNFFLVAYYIAANVGVGDVVKLQVARCFEHKASSELDVQHGVLDQSFAGQRQFQYQRYSTGRECTAFH